MREHHQKHVSGSRCIFPEFTAKSYLKPQSFVRKITLVISNRRENLSQHSHKIRCRFLSDLIKITFQQRDINQCNAFWISEFFYINEEQVEDKHQSCTEVLQLRLLIQALISRYEITFSK